MFKLIILALIATRPGGSLHVSFLRATTYIQVFDNHSLRATRKQVIRLTGATLVLPGPYMGIRDNKGKVFEIDFTRANGRTLQGIRLKRADRSVLVADRGLPDFSIAPCSKSCAQHTDAVVIDKVGQERDCVKRRTVLAVTPKRLDILVLTGKEKVVRRTAKRLVPGATIFYLDGGSSADPRTVMPSYFVIFGQPKFIKVPD